MIFLGVIIVLVGALLLVESKVVLKGDRKIIINDDSDKSIQTPTGTTLLASLSQNNILLPSACGGKGSCGVCTVKVKEGGGAILPTELGHINRGEARD